jgi:hypothetical protein
MVLFVNGKLLVNGAEVPDKVLAAVPLVSYMNFSLLGNHKKQLVDFSKEKFSKLSSLALVFN